MQRSRIIWILSAAFLLPLPFLFLAQLSPDPPWLKRVWDMGHVPLFGLWMLASLYLPLPRTAPFILLRALGLFGIAVAIEFIQLHTGRSFSVTDMYLDACGIALGVRFGVPALRGLPGPRRWALDIILIACLAYGLQDAGRAIADRLYVEVTVPQLWNARQWSPLKRLGGASLRSLSNDPQTGEVLLKVTYIPKKYSGVELVVMDGDWRNYQTLNINMMNPSTEPLDIVCRVHDVPHYENGAKFDDRFNRPFTLAPGWNSLSISLQDIESAPAQRKMQMENIESLACFTIRLPEPRTVYYRAIWLQ